MRSEVAAFFKGPSEGAAAGVDAGPDGARVPPEHRGDLGAGESFEEVEQDRQPQPLRQSVEGTVESPVVATTMIVGSTLGRM